MTTESLSEIPEIALVAERVPYITPGRVARKLSVEFIKRFATEDMIRRGISPTRGVKTLLEDLKAQADPTSEEWNIFFENLFPRVNRLHLMANGKAHTDTWMRDDEYIFEFIENLPFQDHTLRVFESKQRKNGQIPTAVGIFGQTPWHFADDESTLLYIISAATLIKQDKSFLTQKRKECIEKALGFVKQHIYEGMYVTPKGERRGWMDAFEFPSSDVISQNQGLYAVALMALDEMGFDIPTEDINTAISIYQKLAQKRGYLPFSAKFDEAIGAGSLYPDYLAITRYSHSLLSDSMAATTIENLPRSKHGVKILAASPKGDYFDPKYFMTTYQSGEPGNYQHSAVWHRWWNNVMADGELHGVLRGDDRNYRTVIPAQQRKANWAEFVRTGDIYEEIFTPVSPRHLWEIVVAAEHRTVDRVLLRAA